MSNLLIGLLGVMVATNMPAAVSNLISQSTGVAVKVPDPNDPVEKEFKQLMAADDAAEAEVDDWILQNQKFAAQGAAIPASELNQRIRKRIEPVQKAYEDFIKRHPNHARARVAYAGLLHDLDEDAEVEQLEKARELDPTIPSVYNNLANYYGHSGELSNAFKYYAKAIELDPSEPVYYQNFGDTVYLFRKDAGQFYNLTEQQVFDKALDLYTRGVKLDPTNFVLATRLAESYYGIRPVRTDDALNAWTNALKLAGDDVEREGVYIHLARFKMNGGRFDEARAQLKGVTNAAYTELKQRVARAINDRELEAKGTNSPPANPSTNATRLNVPQESNDTRARTNRP